MKNHLNLSLQAAMALSLLGTPAAFAHHMAAREQPDNSAANKNARGETAEDQGRDKNDVAITRKIRREIVKDKSLSIYAHNVKIITRDGMVILKGPVRPEEEKTLIGARAADAAGGAGKVTNQLTVRGE